MLIKAADDREPAIDAIEALLRRPDVDAERRKEIEVDVRKARSGWKRERDAAHEIEFYLGGWKTTSPSMISGWSTTATSTRSTT